MISTSLLEARLHHAVQDNNADEVISLVNSGASVNAIFEQQTAYTRAMSVEHYSVADVIISFKSFDPHAGNQFNCTPLFLAAKQGQVKAIRQLLELGVNVNAADVRGITPLAATTWYDKHEAAEILIQHGADINLQDAIGQTPLHRACFNASIGVARVLLQHNCDVNRPTLEMRTPLMEALPSFYNHSVAKKKMSDALSICEMLINAGCDLNFQDKKGKTALHHAVEANNVHSLCLLAERGCNLEVKDLLGYTPFQTAVLPSRPLYEIARYLLYYGADASPMRNPAGSSTSLVSPLKLVLNHRPPQDEHEHLWSRALLLQTLCGTIFPHSVEEATNMVDNVARAHDSHLAFHEAVELDVIQWLNLCLPCSLQHQARLQVRRTLGSQNHVFKISTLPVGYRIKQYLMLDLHSNRMPLSSICSLHLNIQDFNNEKVREILERDVDVNIPISGKTPLALALELKNTVAAEAILETVPGLSLTNLNADGDTALHIAVRHGNEVLIPKLIDMSDNIDIRNKKGNTPLLEAAIGGNFNIMSVLINKGADLHQYNEMPVPLIHLVTANGAVSVLEQLLSRGVDPNILDQWGNCPLHVAASKGREYLRRELSLPGLYSDKVLALLDVVQMRLTNGLPKLTKEANHAAAVKCLIEYGADIQRTNFENRTPLHIAKLYKAEDVLAVLNMKPSV